MTENHMGVYWFNTATGEIFLSEDRLPPHKRQLYLVMDREKLYFGSFSLQGKKRIKDSNILSIQGHFIPFKDDYMNFIYSAEKPKHPDRHFFFWVGALPAGFDVEGIFYDEIPETLLFKGNPGAIKNYRLFIFQRISGWEIIYYNTQTDDFYSIFEKDPAGIKEKIHLLIRKFALNREPGIRILSEIDIPPIRPGESNCTVEIDTIRTDEKRYFFLPDFFPVKKKFSNLSQSKQIRSIKTIARQWNRNLTIILALLLIVLLLNTWGFIRLNRDKNRLKQKFQEVNDILNASDMIEFRLNKIKNRVSQYPDHMLYLDTISQCLDEDTVLLGYSLGDGRILIEGYSFDSLGLLACLRKSNRFQDVRFKTTVTKNVNNQREKFEIEILLQPPGTETKPGTPGTGTGKPGDQAGTPEDKPAAPGMKPGPTEPKAEVIDDQTE